MATDPQALLLLLNWMSPTFPTGSFAYSHGLEQVIADQQANSAAEVEAWIGALLQNGSLWGDAVLFSLCWTEDPEPLNEFALALAGSAERHLETVSLGKAFAAAAAVWLSSPRTEHNLAYPVAAGTACVAAGIPRAQALLAFLQGTVAVLVSVAVRLVPLGQTQGLGILRNLSGVIAATAERAARAGRDGILNGCVVAEVAAMRHETLETRIFRT
ncbi:MAG: urease accessory UreF family protein [Hyphomicrobiales bacterium]